MFPSCLRSYQDKRRGERKRLWECFFFLSPPTHFTFPRFHQKFSRLKINGQRFTDVRTRLGHSQPLWLRMGFFFFGFFIQILESTKALVLRPLCQRECIKRQLSQAPTSEDGDECGRALTRDFSLKKKSISKKKVQ